MNSVVAGIHSVLAPLFALLWAPLSLLGATWALVASSVVFGILMVFAYGFVSNQSAIRRVKNDITSFILETFLFRYDTRLSLRAQARLFVAGVKYFCLALAPIAILAIPCIFLLSHLNLRLGYRPLSPGETRLLEVQLNNPSALQSVQVSAKSLRIDGPVRTPKEGTAVYRIGGETEGVFEMLLPGGEKQSVVVAAPGSTSTPALGISLSRYDWVTTFLAPNGGSSQWVSGGELDKVQFTYPERVYSFFGQQLTWLVPFLVLSIVAGYIGSKFLGVAV